MSRMCEASVRAPSPVLLLPPPRAQPNAPDVDDESATTSFQALTLRDRGSEHREPALWKAACRYWGGDPNDLNPATGAFCEGWSKENFLLAYRVYSASWALKETLFGSPATFNAHGMGLGKTCVAIAWLWAMMQMEE
ncbi:hypothetical protein H2203_002486 [Taxawa tesnikishii (nom. ined.)]|nr:hypothetical protein H2203_002486 [Dothideales sp. JES 119]